MPGTHVLNPNDPEFERFLYSSVGEDRNGSAVTVLSTLARLGLDPWNEAADLSALGQGAARARLGLLLSQCRDVPALGQDHASVARKLTFLLPERRSPPGTGLPAPQATPEQPMPWWPVVVVVILLLILAQAVFVGLPGAGG